jgi:translation initiation factor 1
MSKDSRLVYSTDRGRLKPKRPSVENKITGDGIVRIRRETAGRRGSAVTTLNGVVGTEAELKALTKKLKRLCGSGGTLKGTIIEIQGDHREKLATVLNEQGYTIKMAGG